MPLTKRQPQPLRSIPSAPSSPTLTSSSPLPALIGRRVSTAKFPPGSFGRWGRERTTSLKGKERAVGLGIGDDVPVVGQWGAAVQEGNEVVPDVVERVVRPRTSRAVNPDSLADRTPQPIALKARASHHSLRTQLDSSGPKPGPPNQAYTPYPSFPPAEHADLTRSLSLLSTAPTQLTSHSSDALIPLSVIPTGPPRKLVKRRPSVNLQPRSLPLLDVSPPTPFRLTEKYSSPTLPLPLGAQVPLADPFTPLLTSSGLSRNGSSSTTTSSLDPTSASNSGDSTQGLITPREDDLADQAPRDIPHQPNRDTFGPIRDDIDISLYAHGDPTPLADELGDDFHPPQFLNDTSSTLDQSPSTTTSSSGLTAQPPRLSPGLERPKGPSAALDHGRPPEPPLSAGRRQRVTSDSGRGTEAPARFPSIYDFSEILRDGALGGPSSDVAGPSRPRSSSTGTIPEWSRTLTRSLSEVSAEEQEILDFLARRDDPPPSISVDPPSLRPIFHSRAAPAPPHLASVLVTPPALQEITDGSDGAGPSSRRSSGHKAVGGNVNMDAPVIPDRSSSLGVLWRRMSGRGGSRQSGSGSSSDSLQLSDAVDEDGKAENGGSEGKKKKEKRPGMIRALSRRRTATSVSELVGDRGEEEVVPPVPRIQYRRHLSVPPTRSRAGAPTEEEISNGWTELDPLPAAPARSQRVAKEDPSPPTRIPHRYSSLPVRPELPILNILTTLQAAAIPEVSALPVSTVTFGPFISPTGETGSERKRRFRRTLVEVEDDLQFQQLLQDEDRRGRDDGGVGEMGLGPESEEKAGEVVGMAVTTNEVVAVAPVTEMVESPTAVEGESDKHSIQAWFVTRELVQGEKRYGRLLARGVSIAQSVTDRETSPDFGAFSPSGLSSIFASPTSQSKRSSKTPSSSPPSTIRGSTSAIPTHARFPSTPSSSALSASRSSSLILSFPAPIDETPPLDILLYRLPRLLALSLTLSSRFAHDPSPDQVATAFLSMEGELLLEMSAWAGEVGRLIATGFGESVDNEMRGEGMSARSSMVELTHSSFSSLTGEMTSPGGSERDNRASFSEILLAPVQRAARYRLLFQSLLNKIPRGSRGREKVQQALLAAERIVQGVNRGQGFDMEGLRRGGGDEGAVVISSKREGGRGMGRRVRSMYT